MGERVNKACEQVIGTPSIFPERVRQAASRLKAFFGDRRFGSIGQDDFRAYPPNVTVMWNDGGAVLYGRIQDIRSKTTALYSNAAIPAGLDGTWDHVRTDAVGGTVFSALSLLGFAECVRDAVRAEAAGDEGSLA